MAVGVDDWLVADSENEDVFTQLPPAICSEASLANHSVRVVVGTADIPTIQTAAFTSDQPRTPLRDRQSPSKLANESLFTPPPAPRGTDLSISDFPSAPSTSAAPPAINPRPRPRPRVVMKKATTFDPNTDIASTSFSPISDLPVSATRRTDDSIRPATVTSFRFSDAIDDAYSSLDIAERAKMRSRKPQSANKSTRAPVQMIDVIELTSDEDELALKPTKRQKNGNQALTPKAKMKPRPKPKLKVKPVVVLPSGLPTVVRDPPAPSPECGFSSQPPVSTLPTLPPSTPPQAREPTPPYSPPVATRKRKRIQPLIAEDDNETDLVSGSLTGASASTMRPPFFAPPSSSVPTDSGIEIPPVEPVSGRKKKQASSGKKGTQKKAGRKGRKGKKGETASAADEMIEDPAGVTREPSTLVMHHTPSFAKESHFPVIRNSTMTEKAPEKQTTTKKGKARAIDSEGEDGLALSSKFNTGHTPPPDERQGQRSKENLQSDDLSLQIGDSPPRHIPTPGPQVRGSSSKTKSTPMSELIRRVNSHPNSPFPNSSRTYSPFLKSSRTMLSKIAPLHPNRRTPPPPLPRPPPPKKSKKRLEMEDRIEEELAETVDGWSCLTDEERRALRKTRIDAELGYED